VEHFLALDAHHFGQLVPSKLMVRLGGGDGGSEWYYHNCWVILQ